MSIVLILIEIWMIIRRLVEDIPGRMVEKNETFMESLFKTSSNFFVLLAFGIAMLSFCLYYADRRKTKGKTIALICLTVPCFLFGFLFPLEKLYDNVSNFLMYSFYLSVVLFGITVIVSTIMTYKGSKSPWITSRLVIIMFAFVCLVFGVRVSYSDFYNAKSIAAGEYKQIICFLMMSLYVGCLLIWKPYVSLGILGSTFLLFYFVIKLNQKDANGNIIRVLPDGDVVNYITFFISLTMICFSIYVQRIDVAKKEEKLETLATTDPLTGLYSFEHFLELVKDHNELYKVEKGKYIFLFFDLRSFKIINDQKGFEKGNEFLKNTGEILSKHYKEVGFVCRQSDDHFIVYAPSKDVEETLKSINEEILMLDQEARISVAVGGYLFKSNDEDGHRAIDKARYACYAIMKTPSILYREYDDEMHRQYHLKQHVIRNLDRAISEGWIRPFYQPVVWAKDGKLCGLEALARWEDPRFGFLSPASFVPALEDNQLIHKLDAAIVEIVCRDIRKRLDEGIPNVPISINFSRLDFELMDAVAMLDSIVQKYRIPKELIHIEVTESALGADSRLLHKAFNELREKGYSLWLDDFGAGYSSFNVLKDYHFDVLKIDMKFLSGFEKNQKAKILLECIIKMAETIGMKTLTEGVETIAEAEFLKKISCGRLQGYLYGKPLRYSELLEKIETGEIVISSDPIA